MNEKTCSFPGCTEEYYCKDLCRRHYDLRKRGKPLKPLAPARRGPVDHTGVVFGSLAVLRLARRHTKPSGQKEVFWLCRCRCGAEVEVRSSHLVSGNTTSCGKRVCYPNTILGLNGGVGGPLRGMFGSYARSAADRDYVFELTWEQFEALTQLPCHYCGKAPEKRIWRANEPERSCVYYANGVDRRDNGQGYTLENAVPCCDIDNKGKGPRDYDTYDAHLAQVATHRLGADLAKLQRRNIELYKELAELKGAL